jgi:hypothetical protein
MTTLGKTILTLLFFAGGVYWGGVRMTPIPVVLAAVAINTALLRRSRNAAPWLADFYRCLCMFLLAELLCFVGSYLSTWVGYIVLHDVAHVASLYFLALAGIHFAAASCCPQACGIAVCPNRTVARPAAGTVRAFLSALLLFAFIAGAVPPAVYLLDRAHPFLSLPQGTTSLSRMINLTILPALSMAISLFLLARRGWRGLPFGQASRALLSLCVGLLLYSYFQLFIHLLEDRIAIFTEEFLEFAPMVPVFYAFVDRPRIEPPGVTAAAQ